MRPLSHGDRTIQPSILAALLLLMATPLGCSGAAETAPMTTLSEVGPARDDAPEVATVEQGAVSKMQLVEEFGLASVRGDGSPWEQMVRLRGWVHARWEHDGMNEPPVFDSGAILRGAAAGERFRCVEYSFVLTDVYLALGWQARVARIQGDGAHVVTEVFVPEFQKWAMMDGQFDAHVTRNDTPLSAWEIAEAIRQDETEDLGVHGLEGLPPEAPQQYLAFYGQYLKYLMVTATPRFGHNLDELLVLVRDGDEPPRTKPPYLERVDARYLVTHDLDDLYPAR